MGTTIQALGTACHLASVADVLAATAGLGVDGEVYRGRWGSLRIEVVHFRRGLLPWSVRVSTMRHGIPATVVSEYGTSLTEAERNCRSALSALGNQIESALQASALEEVA